MLRLSSTNITNMPIPKRSTWASPGKASVVEDLTVVREQDLYLPSLEGVGADTLEQRAAYHQNTLELEFSQFSHFSLKSFNYEDLSVVANGQPSHETQWIYGLDHSQPTAPTHASGMELDLGD